MMRIATHECSSAHESSSAHDCSAAHINSARHDDNGAKRDDNNAKRDDNNAKRDDTNAKRFGSAAAGMNAADAAAGPAGNDTAHDTAACADHTAKQAASTRAGRQAAPDTMVPPASVLPPAGRSSGPVPIPVGKGTGRGSAPRPRAPSATDHRELAHSELDHRDLDHPGLALPALGHPGLDQGALLALSGALGGDQAVGIARQVADMAQGLAALADRLVGQKLAPADTAEADCIAFLESQFRIRRLRSRHLPGLSLGEPAWDILLDLAVAHYWRRETSVTSLCIAADVPGTTALRWISSMTREGLIVRRPCHRDGRRSFLAIGPATYQAMLALAGDALRAADKVRARYQRSAAA